MRRNFCGTKQPEAMQWERMEGFLVTVIKNISVCALDGYRDILNHDRPSCGITRRLTS